MIAVSGVQIWNCVEADTVEGWADVHASDDAGNPIPDGDGYEIERLHGVVEVTLRREPPWEQGS